MAQRTKPPFRADHVGSLLRPAALKEAREKRARGEITRRRPQGGRGPRDRARHQEAGRGRPPVDHRRRIPPLLVASRFPLGSRRRREARDGSRHRICRRDDAQRRREGHRQARHGRPPPDGGAFPVRGGAHEAHAEDHDPGAVGDLRTARCRRRSTRAPIRRSISSGTTSEPPTARPCADSPMPAAATCSSTKCSSRCCATRNTASR